MVDCRRADKQLSTSKVFHRQSSRQRDTKIEDDEIFFELLLSGIYDVFIHDPKFFTLNYMPVSVPSIWKALLVNETPSYYYQLLMTEVKELDMAHDPCINDETYDFQVGH